jgi:hypothetical protein
MSPAARLYRYGFALFTAPLAALACGGEGSTDIVLPALSITTASSGVEVDSDGYSVSIDAQTPQAIAPNTTLTIDRLTDGAHTVELSGVAANCIVGGENPQSVLVEAGRTAIAPFVITCSSTTQSVQVVTTTTGTGTDPDGFALLLDGVSAGAIGVSSTITLAGITAGLHTLELTGLAVNCQVVGGNPREVTVSSGGTPAVQFSVTCTAPAPNTGTVDVVTATGGSGTDSDGFSLVIDGTDRGAIAINTTSSLAGLTPGFHAVGLTGVAANCEISGENPRQVQVPSGGRARVEFAVTCTAPGPDTGTLEVETATAGGGTDPDGFSLLLDGVDRGPIAINTTNSLSGLTPGAHTIGLTGLAANCQISGGNPRPVSVPVGGTVRVTFDVTCAPPGPTTGTLRVVTVTTGNPRDADGYLFSVDHGTEQAIGSSATTTLANISAAQHTVELRGLAANCSVTGNNPIGVAVSAGETARVTFTVACAATVGSLRVSIGGLPAGSPAAVTVAGPNSFSQAVTETTTLSELTPGSYQVTAANLVTGTVSYRASVSRPTVSVTAGSTATVTVTYTAINATPTLNLRIDGLYITQSTQTYTAGVPLVANRDGYLRVFVVANESNTAKPSVRIRLSRPGAAEQVLTISASGGTTPVRVQEGTLGSSWNIPIEGSLIQAGLSVIAELDPENTIAESNEADNRFPATGSKDLRVQSVPVARIRFISVQQPGSSVGGDVSNVNRLIDLAHRMHPLNGIQVDVDPQPFPTSAPLEAGTAGGGWLQLLSDLDGKRVAEGTGQIYYGVVKLGYGRAQGYVGLTLGQGVPTSAGWDDANDAGRVVAHELGHVWNRKHSPCGGPPDVDGNYPYSDGRIGVYGMDVNKTSLKPLSSPDIMSYCFTDPWISDYTYTNVMDFRTSQAVVAARSGPPQPSVLVWGRMVNGQPVLEPAFQIVARPSLPKRPGPYSVTGTTLDGTRLFDLSFDVSVAEDGPAGNGHFAFAVPLDLARASRLQNLRLTGPSGRTNSSGQTAQVRSGSSETLVARREGDSVSLRWDAVLYPMIMIRDPDTGEVLSFARGGTAVVRTGKAVLDLDVSDGVRSYRVRLAINRS